MGLPNSSAGMVGSWTTGLIAVRQSEPRKITSPLHESMSERSLFERLAAKATILCPALAEPLSPEGIVGRIESDCKSPAQRTNPACTARMQEKDLSTDVCTFHREPRILNSCHHMQ